MKKQVAQLKNTFEQQKKIFHVDKLGFINCPNMSTFMLNKWEWCEHNIDFFSAAHASLTAFIRIDAWHIAALALFPP